MQLKQKRIVITGGTSGIGAALLRQLKDDNEVIVLSRSLPHQVDTSARFIKVDLANSEQLESAVDIVLKSYESIDVLINNEAMQNTPELSSEDFDYDGIQAEVDLNFTSICRLSYLLLPLLKKESASTILNINSGLALSPKRSSAIYCATKGALNIFSQSLSYQLKETNIAVFQAFLPLVDTDMTKGRGEAKLSSEYTARKIIDGVEKGKEANDIGKVWLLRLMTRFSPPISKAIMRNS